MPRTTHCSQCDHCVDVNFYSDQTIGFKTPIIDNHIKLTTDVIAAL